ncbi:MAG TPA: thiamine pyrophosphate-binding protein [Baekduia sp.]|uniref:thiamine pyrophosphate-binding protein n=1 Tax=Baekduia sp. TaxID=2600305 RepID=UPI002BE0B664|nr:thiamine pyrophosphate-binding protein [Baekduia sp.]HMJ36552.1 thiamine pyrophosphate-binding protein [Baekduia sp.]
MARYGSDLVVDLLKAGGIEYVALNPGATFRALHDSLAAPGAPETIVVLHEEIAVGIAHGYAKSCGRPMAVFLHDQVGLQHASMALFNAWVDAVPMVVVGGSGPRDTAQRRPWIDWIHSANPEAGVVRDIVKWDAEPASVEALPDVIARALRIAMTPPMGPVYVAVDIMIQEADATSVAVPGSFTPPPAPVTAPRHVVASVADELVAAQSPVILVDRGSDGCAPALLRLAEQLAVPVVDLGGRSFPAEHWADRSSAVADVLGEADLVLGVELRDLTWGLGDVDLRTRALHRRVAADAKVFSIGLNELRHHGTMELEAFDQTATPIVADSATFLQELAEEVAGRDADAGLVQRRRAALTTAHDAERAAHRARAAGMADEAPIAPIHLAAVLGSVLGHDGWQLANGLLGHWPRRLWPMVDERSFLGRSGGEGLGYGMPASVGAALAQRDSDVLVVNVQADGDLMYTPQALWTAAHHNLPLLTVVHNNRTYGRDEVHQLEIAHARGRATDVPPRGIRLEAPNIDFAQLAESQGVQGIGPVEDPGALFEVLESAAATVRRERRPVLVDVITNRDLAR